MVARRGPTGAGPLVLATGPEDRARTTLSARRWRASSRTRVSPRRSPSGPPRAAARTWICWPPGPSTSRSSRATPTSTTRSGSSRASTRRRCTSSSRPRWPTEVSQLSDLHGRRVSLGGAHSGTRQVAERILAHFEVVPVEDLALDPAEAIARPRGGRARRRLRADRGPLSRRWRRWRAASGCGSSPWETPRRWATRPTPWPWCSPSCTPPPCPAAPTAGCPASR